MLNLQMEAKQNNYDDTSVVATLDLNAIQILGTSNVAAEGKREPSPSQPPHQWTGGIVSCNNVPLMRSNNSFPSLGASHPPCIRGCELFLFKQHNANVKLAEGEGDHVPWRHGAAVCTSLTWLATRDLIGPPDWRGHPHGCPTSWVLR